MPYIDNECNYQFSDINDSDPFGLDSCVPNSDENESDSGNYLW